jgi:hypothetical protein
MYRQLEQKTAAAMNSDVAEPVSWTFKCLGGRRIGSCQLDCQQAEPYWTQFFPQSPWEKSCNAERSNCENPASKPTAEYEVKNYCATEQNKDAMEQTIIVVQAGINDLKAIHWRGGMAKQDHIASMQALFGAVETTCHGNTLLLIVEHFPIVEVPNSWAGGTEATSCVCPLDQNVPNSDWRCSDGRGTWLSSTFREEVARFASPQIQFFDSSHLVLDSGTQDGIHYTDDVSIRQFSEALGARLAYLLESKIGSAFRHPPCSATVIN